MPDGASPESKSMPENAEEHMTKFMERKINVVQGEEAVFVDQCPYKEDDGACDGDEQNGPRYRFQPLLLWPFRYVSLWPQYTVRKGFRQGFRQTDGRQAGTGSYMAEQGEGTESITPSPFVFATRGRWVSSCSYRSSAAYQTARGSWVSPLPDPPSPST